MRRHTLAAPGGTKSRAVMVAFVSIAVSLAGCTGPLLAPGASLGSCTFSLAPARAGDEFLYEATGTLGMPLQAQGVVVDWRSTGAATTRNGPLDLVPGSKVAVALGSHPVARVGWTGDADLAYQASYWAEHPNHGRIAFYDEWIDTASGNMVQSNQRAVIAMDGETMHQSAMWKWNRPPLLFAPLFWSTDIHEGIADEVEFAWFWNTAERTSFRYQVTRTAMEQGGCWAEVDVRFSQYGYDHRARIRFDDGVPLPTEYTELNDPRVVMETGKRNAALKLSEYRPSAAESTALPHFRAEPFPERGMKVTPPRAGFMRTTDGVFPTSFDEAQQAMENDTTLRQWQSRYPGARLYEVQHAMGAPGSGIVDRWTVRLASPEGDNIVTKVTRERPVAALPYERLTVSSLENQSTVPYPGIPTGFPSLQDLAEAHRRIYGRGPEVLSCELVEMYCNLGTHAGTRHPFACEAGCAGAYLTGMRLRLETGLIHIEESLDANALSPPIRPTLLR